MHFSLVALVIIPRPFTSPLTSLLPVMTAMTATKRLLQLLGWISVPMALTMFMTLPPPQVQERLGVNRLTMIYG